MNVNTLKHYSYSWLQNSLPIKELAEKNSGFIVRFISNFAEIWPQPIDCVLMTYSLPYRGRKFPNPMLGHSINSECYTIGVDGVKIFIVRSLIVSITDNRNLFLMSGTIAVSDGFMTFSFNGINHRNLITLFLCCMFGAFPWINWITWHLFLRKHFYFLALQAVIHSCANWILLASLMWQQQQLVNSNPGDLFSRRRQTW